MQDDGLSADVASVLESSGEEAMSSDPTISSSDQNVAESPTYVEKALECPLCLSLICE